MQIERSAPASRAQARDRQKQIKQTQDEPQWIVAQRLLSALTIPEVFKSSAKELSFQQRLYN